MHPNVDPINAVLRPDARRTSHARSAASAIHRRERADVCAFAKRRAAGTPADDLPVADAAPFIGGVHRGRPRAVDSARALTGSASGFATDAK